MAVATIPAAKLTESCFRRFAVLGCIVIQLWFVGLRREAVRVLHVFGLSGVINYIETSQIRACSRGLRLNDVGHLGPSNSRNHKLCISFALSITTITLRSAWSVLRSKNASAHWVKLPKLDPRDYLAK